MADDFDFDIPEMNRIGSMMRDLLPEQGPARRHPATKATRGPRSRKIGSYTLDQFAEGANWKNAERFDSPLMAQLATSGGVRLGALSLTKFAEGINWRNALDGPILAVATAVPAATAVGGPPETVDGFFETLQWD
jgi:hypothetical protein